MVLSSVLVGRLVQHHVWNKVRMYVRSTNREGTAAIKIHQEVSQMTPELCRLGKKVVIIIATDGLPTDERGVGGHRQNQEFVESLRCLEGLPVWVVVRLCTDEEDVVGLYNDLDGQLELSLEVLDDFEGEAAEINGENPWLNYALRRGVLLWSLVCTLGSHYKQMS